MRTIRRLASICAMSLLTVGCGQGPDGQGRDSGIPAEPSHASSKDFGDYVLYFNAIRTDGLTPEVARAYDIVRSKNRAMLNVSIIQKQDQGPGKSVPGTVVAQASNLTGQVKNLNLRQISEGDAFYYIGEVPVANAETLIFNIDATPADAADEFSVRFSRQFFAD